jgi:acetoin utilization deacetylase AcuC-like enzyme
MIKIAYSPVYKYILPEGHRFPMDKYHLLPEQLFYEGLVDESFFFTPDPLTDTEILLTHSEVFVNKLNALSLSKKEVREIGFPVTKALIDRAKVISGGTYQCALFALDNHIALNIAGGTHHSFAHRGEGFCVLNDFAIAANLLLEKQLVKQILIVDLDVHQGNGTASIFKDRKEVFTLSVHGEKNFPLRKEVSDLDVPLADGTRGDKYLEVLKRVLPDVIDRVRPDFVFYLSGVDVLETDKLGRLALTKPECKLRDDFVFQTMKNNGIPVAVSMGGGYSIRIADIVDAHANTFKSALETFQ